MSKICIIRVLKMKKNRIAVLNFSLVPGVSKSKGVAVIPLYKLIVIVMNGISP